MKIGKNDYGSADFGPRSIPDDGEVYEAVIAGAWDCGWQPGHAGKKPRRTLCVAIELEWTDRTGRREVVFSKYGMSLYASKDGGKRSGLRALFDTVFPDRDNSEADTDDLRGKPIRVLIEHNRKGDKVYANIKSVTRSKAPIGPPQRDYSQPFGLWKYLTANQMTEAAAKAELARIAAAESAKPAGGGQAPAPERRIVERNGVPVYEDTGEEAF